MVSEVIDHIFRFQESTVIFYCLKFRFQVCFKAGISFGKDEVIPENKGQLIEETKKLISEYETQYRRLIEK